MFELFKVIRLYLEPVAIEAAITNGSAVAKDHGINQTGIALTQAMLNISYKGPELFLANELALSSADKVTEFLGTQLDSLTYEEPTVFSTSLSALIGTGTCLASGSGILGTSLGQFIGNSAEPVIRKFQFEMDKQSYISKDEAQDRESLEYFENHGYTAPGF